MNVLYFSTVWPQLNISADTLMKNKAKISFISSAKRSKLEQSDLKQYLSVSVHSIDPNDERGISTISQNLQEEPEVAIFDTFVSEEMFSPHVYNKFPNCLRVVDTQDFHSLRVKRQEVIQKTNELNFDVLNANPTPKESEYTSRELASFYRSDLVLFPSDYEQMKVKQNFNLENTGVITFFYDQNDIDIPPKTSYTRRKDFVWLGNFGHPPNLDSVKWIINDIWPKISKELPESELHLYGANFPKEITEMESNTIKCKGMMKTLTSLAKYRVMLTPLRFGAGIKGKISDSWLHGLPVITTPIGCEGMFKETYDNNFEYRKLEATGRFYTDIDESKLKGIEPKNKDVISYYNYSPESLILAKNLTFGGVGHYLDSESIANAAVEMYTNKELWYEYQEKGNKILDERMSFGVNEGLFNKYIYEAQSKMVEHRKKNHIQSLVWSETLRSHDKLSKYLIEKNKNKQQQQQQQQKAPKK